MKKKQKKKKQQSFTCLHDEKGVGIIHKWG